MKKCPLTKNNCLKNDCAWFVEKYEECTMKPLGEGIADLAVYAEDEGIKVVQVNDN